MRIAVVELYADRLRGKRNRVALFRAIRDDKKRNSTVLAALQSIPKDHLVVFPGWTFYGSAPSEFVTEAKAHRLVVYEEIVDGFDLGRALDKGSPGFIYQWTTPVVGADVETPLVGQQIISHSGEVEQTKMKALYQELLNNRQGKVLPEQLRFLLLICGEVVFLAGGGSSRAKKVQIDETYAPFSNIFKSGFPLVINPAHLPRGPNANTDKRKWLSKNVKDAVLVTTANVYEGNGYFNSTHTAQQVYKNGVRKRAAAPLQRITDDRYAVHYFDL